MSEGTDDPDCPTPETIYPRFDFNGDGEVSRSKTALVPLKPDGSVAATPSEAVQMTDLEVLMSQWESDLERFIGIEEVAVWLAEMAYFGSAAR